MEKLTCNSLRKADAGKKVTLDGWVHTIRDHGDTFFIDLRDRDGITQLVAKRDNVPEEVFDKLNAVTRESVIEVEGNVKERPSGTENEDLDTGEIELEVTNIKILNMCQQLPYHWKDYDKASPEVRLKYRYIDLRAPNLYRNMLIRSQVTTETYKFLQKKGFIHVETPILTKSTPEGARDYLVPSRVHKGKFYALPQSPQLFKQLLMVSGIQKYFQITRCFRDEDLRNDRQPEFTQLDIEMSFVTQEDIINLIEDYLVHIFKEVLDVKIERPFPRLSYEEAMSNYGVDKPDIRFGLKLVEITDLIPEDTEIFKEVFSEGGIISAIKVDGYGDISRKKFEKYRRYVRIFKAKDVGNILLRENETKTPLSRFVDESVIDAIIERLEAKQGDMICFIGGEKDIVYRSLGELRLKIAEDLDLIPKDEFKFLWVLDFPLFEWNEDDNRWTAMHHPFTSCKEEYLDSFDEKPGEALANAYDVVLNGYELGGGSIRNHKPDIQERMFKALEIPPEIAKANFSFLIEALKYGAPPHGGIALGFDRLLMLMVGEESLRDVIAFPKNRNAVLPVGNAPDRVTNEQLDTLGIELTPEVKLQLEEEAKKQK